MKNEIVEKFVELVCKKDTNHNLLEMVADSCVEIVSDDDIASTRGYYIETKYVEQVDEVIRYIVHLKRNINFKFQNDDNIEYLTPLIKPYPCDLKEICTTMINKILEIVEDDGYLDDEDTIDTEYYVLSYLDNIVKRYNKVMIILEIPNKDL